MTEPQTISVKVHFRRGSHGRKRLRVGPPPAPPDVPEGRVPTIARTAAMAVQINELLRRSAFRDYAAAARHAQVTRARMTQVMDLLCLAPDILEEILFLPRTIRGRDAITERSLRPVIAEPEFEKQRALWKNLRAGQPLDVSATPTTPSSEA